MPKDFALIFSLKIINPVKIPIEKISPDGFNPVATPKITPHSAKVKVKFFVSLTKTFFVKIKITTKAAKAIVKSLKVLPASTIEIIPEPPMTVENAVKNFPNFVSNLKIFFEIK